MKADSCNVRKQWNIFTCLFFRSKFSIEVTWLACPTYILCSHKFSYWNYCYFSRYKLQEDKTHAETLVWHLLLCIPIHYKILNNSDRPSFMVIERQFHQWPPIKDDMDKHLCLSPLNQETLANTTSSHDSSNVTKQKGWCHCIDLGKRGRKLISPQTWSDLDVTPQQIYYAAIAINLQTSKKQQAKFLFQLFLLTFCFSVAC